MQLIESTSGIVASYVENNSVAAADLPALIKTIYATLVNIEAPASPTATVANKLTPSQIRKSITDGGLVSFEDGKIYQTLKRHLSTRGMTLADYTAKWGLPNDYPTTAPAYAAKRSEMAKAAGLGRKATSKPAPAKRGRPKKVMA
jgi:predicted transcriptional regulator